MKEFDKAKQEYLNIKASDNLSKKVENNMKKVKVKNIIFRKSMGAVASFALVAIIALNSVPAFAQTMMKNPYLKNVVNVLTFGRFQFDSDEGYSADIKTAGVEGLENTELEELINKELSKNATTIKDKFIEDVVAFKTTYGNKNVNHGVVLDYDVKTNNNDYLSIDVILTTTDASAAEEHYFYTIDKKSEKIIVLEDVCNKDNAKKIILDEMKRRNQEENGAYFMPDDELAGFETTQALNNIEKFYINENGNVVICFNEGEIAANSMGSPEFEIK